MKVKYIILFATVLLVNLKGYAHNRTSVENPEIVLNKKNYSIKIIKKGFRFSILKPGGEVLLPAHNVSGIDLLRSPIATTRLIENNDRKAEFLVINDIGVAASVTIHFFDYYFKISIAFKDKKTPIEGAILVKTQGLYPAYGLADHRGWEEPFTTNVHGYKSDYFGAMTDTGEHVRAVSNFVIFPKQGLALVNMEPREKIIQITKGTLAQGAFYASEMPAMYYFIGSTKQIYADYLKARNEEGYKVYQPKYEWFGLGWEAFGALAWNTNQKTVKEDVDHYLRLGFPLKWLVVGSGFWPNDDPQYASTTSFGYWDKEKYPTPKAFIDYFHQKGLKFNIGLRIAFLPTGPYTSEGLKKGYFIKKDGKPRLFKVAFPKSDSYFLDGSNPQAVQWYVNLCDKWAASGVDGYKEDVYGYDFRDLPDDKLNKVNEALMDKGVYIMGRNNYLGSAADIHRYADFNYNMHQDRGPVNGLAFAYSGFPYVYPDIVGGTGLTNRRYGEISKQKLAKYMMRAAQYMSVNPSMSVGYGPWHLEDSFALRVIRDATLLHDRLHPFIYSAAIRTHLTGFPYTLTPLTLAYPDDERTYHRENEKIRGYQWLINDALLAFPLYGNDYDTAETRNVYLPKGKWIDYDNGKLYQGPLMLDNFNIPVDKTPLFVGGPGFVVEQIDGQLKGRVYPVGYQGETIFYDKDGKTKSVIQIENTVGATVRIKDMTTGKKIKTKLVRHAYEFDFVPGHDYAIQ